ncbi:MAG TPA: GNAT family N-acetyltransferase [Sporichthya sp.]|nr:GNAT family N-acetyltransferase [Sporichthya sp.]
MITLAYDEEVAWWGQAESSRDEIAHYVAFSGGVESGVVLDDGGRIRAFALVTPTQEAIVFLDPAEPDPPLTLMYDWALAQGATRAELPPDVPPRIDWLKSRGWTHTRSAFDLIRAGTEPAGDPVWPAGVRVRPYRRGEDDVAMHRLVYVDAAFASVPGHPDRPVEAWRQMFTAENVRGWVVERGERPVGWVIGRVSDDGHGWVYQLAVAVDERGVGLGRALLLHSFADLLAAGATSLGLAVQAANDRAIGLYRSVGLRAEKEWQVYERGSD